MKPQEIIEKLQSIVGSEAVVPGTGSAPEWWPNKPFVTVNPAAVSELQQIVALAESEAFSILPAGSSSRIETGYAPTLDRPIIQVGTARFDQLLDHQPDDLTVTCRPGITLDSLQNILAQHGQFLPLDIPLSWRSTLGGIVASNSTGFWRPAYGAPRDLLIGMRVMMADGTEVKGGGKVVKNVAGYDLCKLFTGSWGTLGLLTELTFKVRPLPETRTAFSWNAPDLTAACRAGLAIHHARIAPAFVLATNERSSVPMLITEMHGSPERVAWQADAFAKIALDNGLSTTAESMQSGDVVMLNDHQARLDEQVKTAARIACLPAELPELIKKLSAIDNLQITANCCSGILNAASMSAESETIRDIDAALPAGANRVWIKLPSELSDRSKIDIWGAPREDFILHRAIKHALDPERTFNPGRFLGRL